MVRSPINVSIVSGRIQRMSAHLTDFIVMSRPVKGCYPVFFMYFKDQDIAPDMRTALVFQYVAQGLIMARVLHYFLNPVA